MLSFTTVSTRFRLSSYSLVDFNPHSFPSILFVVNPITRRTRKQDKCVALNLVGAREGGAVFGFSDFKKGYYRDSCCGGCGGFVRRCKKGLESEGDLALEAEILEFMRISEDPNAFPTKKQLVEAGRMDLVEGILKQGGWLSLGWDLDDGDEEEAKQEGVQEHDYVNDWESIMARKCNIGVVQHRENGGQESNALEGNEVPRSGFSSFAVNSSHLASSSGRSLEIASKDDSGIEGILSRLEKERNISLGFGLREKGNSARSQSNDSEDDWLAGTSMDATVAGIEKSSRPATLSHNKGIINDLGSKPSQTTSLSDFDGLGNSLKPEMWRSWSNQRAGFSAEDFEAAEITLNETRMDGALDASKEIFFTITEGISEPLGRRKETNPSQEEINHNQIRNHLQNLELELSSVLCSLRPRTDEVASQKGHANSSDDLPKLSDVWEFQENEIMNTQNRLRSIRAKLAVLEGKMALAIIDAQKMVELKQNRINDARTALRLLRTACLVWPNSGSEVLLAGSFDGWATQRKMEKSSTGIFSLCLQLYPGRYEIKFIVDGQWRIDPLRPIVHSNGHENNLLIIT